MSVIMDAANKNDENEEPTETKNESTETKSEGPADFETAIEAAGFGMFNVLLIIMTFATCAATAFATASMSYILPIAECDLKLTLIDKGVLNAVTYAGMICSAILWGYLSDTQGRKKILVFGFLADAACVIGSSLSQNFNMLVVFKFFGGFFINGPGAVIFTYLSELHCAKQRPRVVMVLGMVTSFCNLALPLLAWAIFPQDWDFVFFGFLNVHSWQIFLLVCALPSLISGLAITALPESPKFLMSQGRNQEALKAFQTIFAVNKRQPKLNYPIRHLVEEVPDRNGNANEIVYTIETKNDESAMKVKRKHRSFSKSLADGMQQIKPMFRKPLLGYSLHVYTMQFCILLGLNTIRLWLPQIFASIAEYEAMEKNEDASTNLCTILEYSVNKTTTTVVEPEANCDAHKNISVDMYTNNFIVAVSGLIGFFLAGVIVRALGAKRLLTLGLIISGSCGIGLYWSSSGLTTLIISSIFVTVGSISTSSLLGLVLNLFPTSLRTLIIAIALMFGRLGALSGNMLFPVFIGIGCIPPFLMVAFAMFFAAALSCILPNAKDFMS